MIETIARFVICVGCGIAYFQAISEKNIAAAIVFAAIVYCSTTNNKKTGEK